MKNGEFIIMNKFILALVFVAAVSASGNFVEFLNDLHVGQQCQNNINTYTVTAFTVTPFPPARGDKCCKCLNWKIYSSRDNYWH